MTDETTTTPPPGGDTTTPPPNGDTAPSPGGAGDTPPPGDGKPGARTTIAGGGAGGDGTPPAGKWPENWRSEMASGDEKLGKLLERYATPSDAAKALREAQKTIDAGLKKGALPDNPTEEQLKAYREANGIPEKPEGYLDKMPDGIVLGDADKELASGFLEAMHAQNAPPGFVHAALGWYNHLQEQQIQQQAVDDKAFHSETVEALREEWGSEFKLHSNSITNLIETYGEPLEDGTPFAEWLESARTPDGQRLGDHPAFLKTMLSIAMQVNPAGVVMPGEGMGQIDKVQSEIAEIQKLMDAGSPKYWKDEKMQERYRKLLTAQEKLAERQAS